MTCPYCRGTSPERRNPRRCWGCGAQMTEAGPTFLIDTSLLQQQQNYYAAMMQNTRVGAGQMYPLGGYWTGGCNQTLSEMIFGLKT